FRNGARSYRARPANKNALHRVPDNLASDAARPAVCWPIEATPFPPVGIAPGRVYCRLKAAGQSFADLIAGHEQPLARLGACGMKLKLLWIWLVIGEPVLS